MNGWMDEWLDEWIDGWMDGWMDGRRTELISYGPLTELRVLKRRPI